ncbi:MAG TPA: hypothetical protein V6C91_16865 [Coleofasciculaceae cyanobacterium]
MFRQFTIKQPSKSLPTSLSLQNLVVDLEPQYEESISGGSDIPHIQPDWFLSHASHPLMLSNEFGSSQWCELLYLSGLRRTRRIVGREKESVV